jgi:Uma2 family endonuclease
MTATLSPPAPHASDPTLPHPWVVLDGISWEVYDLLVRDLDDAESKVRVTYDNGRLVLMSPLFAHEGWKKLIGGMIELLALELNIPMRRLGSSTWRRKDVRKGLEADECYYVQHESRVRGKAELDLKRDPPPDLAVEIDITHFPVDREGIYAGLGVPELWQYKEGRVRALLRDNDGKYAPAEHSAAFPFLKVSEIERFLALWQTTDETTILRAWREWVKTSFAQHIRP